MVLHNCIISYKYFYFVWVCGHVQYNYISYIMLIADPSVEYERETYRANIVIYTNKWLALLSNNGLGHCVSDKDRG